MLTVGNWLSMTKENPKDEDKRWFGIETTQGHYESIKPKILNKIRGNLLFIESSIKKGIHVDLYVNKYEMDIINKIIDDSLCKKEQTE